MSRVSKDVVFYGDFNCPFCYVENERLVELGLHAEVEFRSVEHMPSLPVPWDESDQALQSSLTEELGRLAEKAPEAVVTRPGSVPNSRAAIAASIAVVRAAPERAAMFRTALFRALWQDGRDISDEAVIREIWGQLGQVIAPERSDRATGRIWLTEWNNGGFDRRIPVLATPTGERFLGLASADQIAAFLGDPEGHSQHAPDVCEGEDR